MLEHAWFSVISPESCSSILWRTWEQREIAAEALKLTAQDNFEFGIIDAIIPEPIGGAHTNHEEMAKIIKPFILKELEKLEQLSVKERIKNYFRLKAITRFIRKNFSTHEVVRQPITLESAALIGIIFNASHYEEMLAAIEYSKKLDGFKKNIKLMGFVNEKKATS